MVEFHGQSDVGRRRLLNEDAIYTRDGLFLVCDGIGGHKAGEVASTLAAATIASFVARSAEDPEMTWPYGYDPRLSSDANRLATAIRLANRAVFHKAASADQYTGMGTTVAAVLVHDRGGRMTYAHVGDSRIYVIGPGMIQLLTRDDTWANLDWPDGVDALPDAPMKNVLTKALGAREDVEFDIRERELQETELVLLCSDGLTNMLSDERILDVVSTRPDDLKTTCQHLVSSANAEGGRDNISVILLRYQEDGLAR
jgi:PPM family protein phosphatase